MSARLQGKMALVTGAGGGIGRAIALRFAGEGASVVCADIDAAAAESTAALVAGAGGRSCSTACDVSDTRSAAAAVATALRTFGRLDILVNNAAVWIPDGSVVDIAEADWNRTLAVNLTGAFLMSKHAVPAIAAAGGGSIIHIASQLGHVAKPGRSWYGAAKAALIQLAKVMAADHAVQNVRVNSLSPGPIGTERMTASYGSAEQANAVMGSRTMLGRIGRPEEIADAAVFLASDESSFMTGADLLVDGGYVAL